MLQVGLTGNIASGKSHVSCVFAELGAQVIDADIIAHELFSPGTPTYVKVVEAFGEEILAAERKIDRKILGDIIFRDAEKRRLLNTLVHPDVCGEVMERIQTLKGGGFEGIAIVDAALMVESGFHKKHDVLILLFCEAALQLSRVMSRSGLGVEEAQLRIASQWPVSKKLALADYTIDTSGTYARTREQVMRIWNELNLTLQRRQGMETAGP